MERQIVQCGCGWEEGKARDSGERDFFNSRKCFCNVLHRARGIGSKTTAQEVLDGGEKDDHKPDGGLCLGALLLLCWLNIHFFGAVSIDGVCLVVRTRTVPYLAAHQLRVTLYDQSPYAHVQRHLAEQRGECSENNPARSGCGCYDNGCKLFTCIT